MDPALPVAASPIPGAVRVLHTSENSASCERNGIALAGAGRRSLFVPFERTFDCGKAVALFSKKPWAVRRCKHMDPRFYSHGSSSWTARILARRAERLWTMARAGSLCASRSIPIWVKVQVTIEGTWVEAARPIAAGKLIDASQLVIHSGPRFPFGAMPLDSIDRVAGKAALRSIRAGEPILERADQPARSGAGRYGNSRSDQRLGEAGVRSTAESSGHTGEAIVLRNPETGRYFQARIEGKDKVGIRK